MQFDKCFIHFFFINVTNRDCNFTIGTILGKDFAQALVHTSQHLCLQHSCCDLHALVLVQKPFPKIVPTEKLDIDMIPSTQTGQNVQVAVLQLTLFQLLFATLQGSTTNAVASNAIFVTFTSM